jgi:SynChlorMet cassette radical SAM/SPASM protein ScmF
MRVEGEEPVEGGAEGASRTAPPLRSLYFYLTEGCNLACRHCWVSPRRQTEPGEFGALDLQLYKDIIRQAKELGLHSIKLTGGEPLLHPQIEELIVHAREAGLGFAVETNGVLCTRSLAHEIAQFQRPSVSVSLDGVDAETHEWMRGVPGCFESAVEGIRNLVSEGIHPQVIMAVTRRNEHQMEQLIALAHSLKAGSVKFCFVSGMSRGARLQEEGELFTGPETVERGMWVEQTLQQRSPIGLYTSMPPAFRPLRRVLSGEGHGRCNLYNILGVLWDGSYALCGIGASVPDLVFGNASKDPLARVWQDTPTLWAIRDDVPGRLGGVCGRCLLKGLCLGQCVAQNQYFSGSMWSGYWVCQQALEAGMFPEYRLRP